MATIRKTLAIHAEQTTNQDGSITIRAKALADDREIGVGEAADRLGFADRGIIYGLLDTGELRGWKPASARGNGKWRISLQSVLDYRERQARAANG